MKRVVISEHVGESRLSSAHHTRNAPYMMHNQFEPEPPEKHWSTHIAKRSQTLYVLINECGMCGDICPDNLKAQLTLYLWWMTCSEANGDPHNPFYIAHAFAHNMVCGVKPLKNERTGTLLMSVEEVSHFLRDAFFNAHDERHFIQRYILLFVLYYRCNIRTRSGEYTWVGCESEARRGIWDVVLEDDLMAVVTPHAPTGSFLYKRNAFGRMLPVNIETMADDGARFGDLYVRWRVDASQCGRDAWEEGVCWLTPHEYLEWWRTHRVQYDAPFTLCERRSEFHEVRSTLSLSQLSSLKVLDARSPPTP